MSTQQLDTPETPQLEAPETSEINRADNHQADQPYLFDLDEDEPTDADSPSGRALKIDWRRIDWRGLVVFVAGFALLIKGVTLEVPSAYIDGVMPYINGDAYNYMIEAALRGGQISGAMAAQAIYVSIGVLLMALSILRGKRK